MTEKMCDNPQKLSCSFVWYLKTRQNRASVPKTRRGPILFYKPCHNDN